MSHIALISEHASPLGMLGGADSGGQNVYVGQVARNLASLGHSVDVFTRRDDPRLPEVAEWLDGVRLIHVPAGPPVCVRKEDLLPFMGEFSEYAIRFAESRPMSYDIVHANFWMSGLVAADLKRTLGIPFVITFHALGRVRRLHQGAADQFPDARFPIEDRIIEETDRIIAECPQDEEDFLNLYNADPRKITVVPCGFDPSEFGPMSKALARTVLGRHIYAVGGNAEAARLAGVRVKGVQMFVYSTCGLLAGLGGVIMASQLKSGAPTYGAMYELYVIAAVVVGGTSLSGGEGRILGTLIGAFIIAVIQNGMNLTNVESYTQKVVLGLVILGAVLLDQLKHRGWWRRPRGR